MVWLLERYNRQECQMTLCIIIDKLIQYQSVLHMRVVISEYGLFTSLNTFHFTAEVEKLDYLL